MTAGSTETVVKISFPCVLAQVSRFTSGVGVRCQTRNPYVESSILFTVANLNFFFFKQENVLLALFSFCFFKKKKRTAKN